VRVLVLGGTGFVSGAAVRRLLAEGCDVVLFHRGDSSGGARTIRGDRRELLKLRGEFERLRPEIVLDTIAYTEKDAEDLVRTFRGLAKRTVVLSSQDVYAPYGRLLRLEAGSPNPSLLSEDAPLRSSRHPYRAMARAGEMAYDYEKILVERAARTEPVLPATVLRLPSVYGPGDPQRRLRTYLERMTSPELLMDRAKAAWRWTRGYVEDVAEAIARVCLDSRATGKTYNVGEEDALSEAEWTVAIGKAAGWDGEVRRVGREELPEGLAEPYDFAHDLAADTRRIREDLGYCEPVGRDEGLRRTVAWEKEQPASS
jgi:nucleoside-diphosphate-sugar epimerase